MKMLNNFLKIKRDKKAQVGGTLTWVVATIIIIFILLIGIFAASVLGKTKYLDLSFNEELKSSGGNWENLKNNMAFEKNSLNKEKIQKWLDNKTLENS